MEVSSTPMSSTTMSETGRRSAQPIVTESTSVHPGAVTVTPSDTTPLKHKASWTSDASQSDAHKRQKLATDDKAAGSSSAEHPTPTVDGEALANDLAQELQCGCCSALVYRPVMVYPCEHFFCGSCCFLWINNGGANCPVCRRESTKVKPSRPLQVMVDILLRAAPWKARSARERLQADDVYSSGSMTIPAPREVSPPPQNELYIHPCPHCDPENPYGWSCPEPIPDPSVDIVAAWRTEDGIPNGHAACDSCGNILAIGAPSTTKCNFCGSYQCGLNVHGDCFARSPASQSLYKIAHISDLLLSQQLFYECFNANAYEMEIFIDYMMAQSVSPVQIYKEIIADIEAHPQGFARLLETGNIVGVGDKICNACAAGVFFWGIWDWWIKKRRIALSADLLNRADCPDGRHCQKQRDSAHSKELNHIIVSDESVANTSANVMQVNGDRDRAPQPTEGADTAEPRDASAVPPEAPAESVAPSTDSTLMGFGSWFSHIERPLSPPLS